MSNTINTDIVNEFVKERILIYLKKNKDYGDSVLKSLIKFGDISALVRIEDKVNRYLQLTANKEAEVTDEGVYDTLLDLFNYSMMYQAYGIDGARILLKDLVNCMSKEANHILYGEYNKSFTYELLIKAIELSDIEAVNILKGIKEQIQP